MVLEVTIDVAASFEATRGLWQVAAHRTWLHLLDRSEDLGSSSQGLDRPKVSIQVVLRLFQVLLQLDFEYGWRLVDVILALVVRRVQQVARPNALIRERIPSRSNFASCGVRVFSSVDVL